MASEDTLKLARELATLADKHKGEDILVLDVSGLHSLIDCFVIVTARSSKHASVIGDEAYRLVKNQGVAPWHKEPASNWICCDFSDVVIHVFTSEAREYYSFASLWADAEQVTWTPSPASGAVPA
jgi:ribosome-associated protein